MHPVSNNDSGRYLPYSLFEIPGYLFKGLDIYELDVGSDRVSMYYFLTDLAK